MKYTEILENRDFMKQRVKKIINWIVIVAVILIVGFFYSFVRNDEVIHNAAGNVSAYEGLDIVTEFECKEDMLSGVKMQFVPNGDTSGVITYVVKDAEGNNVTEEKSLKIKSLKEDEATLLKFDMIKNSADKNYMVVISCDKEAGHGVTVVENTEIKYSYIQWDLETMVVFCLGALYLVGLAKVLMWMFRK